MLFYIVRSCQSSIFLFADWSKPHHVTVRHKTSCSLHTLARGQPVHNEIIYDRSIIESEQCACASTMKFQSSLILLNVFIKDLLKHISASGDQGRNLRGYGCVWHRPPPPPKSSRLAGQSNILNDRM